MQLRPRYVIVNKLENGPWQLLREGGPGDPFWTKDFNKARWFTSYAIAKKRSTTYKKGETKVLAEREARLLVIHTSE